MPDPRSPVVVGVGQVEQRLRGGRSTRTRSTSSPTRAASPTPTRRRPASLLDRVDVVSVAQIGSWPYPDPGALLARLLGIEPRATLVSTVGGNSPQLLINELAERIQRNELDVAIVGGAESMHTRWRARREPKVAPHLGLGRRRAVRMGDRRRPARRERLRGRALRARAADGVPAVRDRAARRGGPHGRRAPAPRERAVGALRRGRGDESERVVAAGLLGRGDPHGHARQPHGVLPVPEAHVRQHRRRPGRRGAPLLVRSGARRGRARRPHGVPARGRRGARPLLLQRTVDAHRLARHRDHGGRRARGGGHRRRRHRALRPLLLLPVRGAGRAARRSALADDDPRPLTVTGGLGFAGGPVNNYPTHAIARMVEVLRTDPDVVRVHDRARLVHLEARGRHLVGHAARARVPARRSTRRARRRSTRSRVAGPPGSSTARSRSRRRRSRSSATARRHSASSPRSPAPASASWPTSATHDALLALTRRGARGPDRAGHQRRQDEHALFSTDQAARGGLARTVKPCNPRVSSCCGAGRRAGVRGAAAGTCSAAGSRWWPTARGAACTSSARPATGPARSPSTRSSWAACSRSSFIVTLILTVPDMPVVPVLAIAAADRAPRPARRLPVLEDAVGRDRPRLPPAARPQRAPRRADPALLSGYDLRPSIARATSLGARASGSAPDTN